MMRRVKELMRCVKPQQGPGAMAPARHPAPRGVSSAGAIVWPKTVSGGPPDAGARHLSGPSSADRRLCRDRDLSLGHRESLPGISVRHGERDYRVLVWRTGRGVDPSTTQTAQGRTVRCYVRTVMLGVLCLLCLVALHGDAPAADPLRVTVTAYASGTVTASGKRP